MIRSTDQEIFCFICLFEHFCARKRFKKGKSSNNVFSDFIQLSGGPRGRVVKVADFSALDHSIISPMWVSPRTGHEFIYETSHVLLAGVSGGFSPGTPVFAPPTD